MTKQIMTALRAAIWVAFFIASAAHAQTSGTVTKDAFAVGKGAGVTGYTSVLCGTGQIPIKQSGAAPQCFTLSGDATMNASGVVAIGAGKVTNSMLAGSIAANKLVGTDIATVGTITAGTWQGTPINLGGAYVNGTLAAARFPALTGDVTTTAGALATTIANSAVTNAKSAQMAARTIKGNPTASTANASDFTIGGLTARGTPDATNDKVPIEDAASGTIKYVTPTQLQAAVTSGVASLGGQTGIITCGNGISCTGSSISSTGRLKLTADTTYNVPAQFSTVCAAINNLSDNIDGGSHNVTIQIANGSYDMGAGCYVRPTPGVNILLIQGNVANKQSVELYGSGSMLVQGQEPNTTVVRWSDLKFTGNAGGMLLASVFHGNVWAFNNIYWKLNAANQIGFSTSGGTNVNFNGAHSLEAPGSGPIFMFAGDNGFASMEPDFVGTVVGNPVMAATVQVTKSGAISAQNATWTNGSAATGNKWVIVSNGTFDMTALVGQIPGNSSYSDGTAVIKAASGAAVFGAGVVAVSGLPTCNNDLIGSRTTVFDNATAYSFGSTITSGGSFVTPVFCNGSSWRQG